MGLLDYLVVALLSLFAVASVVWYFRMRRKTLLLTKGLTDELERTFRPVDKSYVLLGYLVGYRARYLLENGDKVYVLLTTLPRHSLIYYPIVRALGRRDRLEVAVEGSRRYVLRDLHAVLARERRDEAVIRKDLGQRVELLSKRVVETPRGEYLVYYEDSGDLELVRRLLSAEGPIVYRLSTYKRFNLVSVAVEAREDSVPAAVKLLRELSRYVTASARS